MLSRSLNNGDIYFKKNLSGILYFSFHCLMHPAILLCFSKELHILGTLEKYFFSLTCRNYVDSTDTVRQEVIRHYIILSTVSDTFYADILVKLIWRFSGDLIYHVFFIKSPDNFQTNFTIKYPFKVSLSTLSLYNLHTNHAGN